MNSTKKGKASKCVRACGGALVFLRACLEGTEQDFSIVKGTVALDMGDLQNKCGKNILVMFSLPIHILTDRSKHLSF